MQGPARDRAGPERQSGEGTVGVLQGGWTHVEIGILGGDNTQSLSRQAGPIFYHWMALPTSPEPPVTRIRLSPEDRPWWLHL